MRVSTGGREAVPAVWRRGAEILKTPGYARELQRVLPAMRAATREAGVVPFDGGAGD
ncbi:MAG: hypothetical protein HUU15_03470 [Candidatus Brocadiae bacterium]|nr:hypothetical protein [Candidatus Brocadiia bacterium]